MDTGLNSGRSNETAPQRAVTGREDVRPKEGERNFQDEKKLLATTSLVINIIIHKLRIFGYRVHYLA